MSKIDNVIAIHPPLFLNLSKMQEHFTISGFSCPECNGTGWFWGSENGEQIKKECSTCNGKGKLEASISIKWQSEGTGQ